MCQKHYYIWNLNASFLYQFWEVTVSAVVYVGLVFCFIDPSATLIFGHVLRILDCDIPLVYFILHNLLGNLEFFEFWFSWYFNLNRELMIQGTTLWSSNRWLGMLPICSLGSSTCWLRCTSGILIILACVNLARSVCCCICFLFPTCLMRLSLIEFCEILISYDWFTEKSKRCIFS